MQYLVFLVLFNQNYWSETGFPRLYVFLDALLFTILLQVAIHLAKKAYQSKDADEVVLEQPVDIELEDDDEIPQVEVVEKRAPAQGDIELVIVHGASWCGWSKKQMDEFPAIKSALEQKNVSVREVEDKTPEGQKMSQQFEIDGYPGSLVFKDGNLVDKIGGYKPANALIQQVLSHL